MARTHQLETSIRVFSDLGFHAIAPDMRGYGQSSIYNKHTDYAQQEIVKDMIDLHAHLGGGEAIWVGHDWVRLLFGILFQTMMNLWTK